jgi:ornithine--oxo-acid transaminase
LAAAVGLAVIGLLNSGEYQERARVLGEHLRAGLQALVGRGIV